MPLSQLQRLGRTTLGQAWSHWLARAADEGWTCLYFHDPDTSCGRLARDAHAECALPQ